MNDEEKEAAEKYPVCWEDSKKYLPDLTFEYIQLSLRKAFLEGIKYRELIQQYSPKTDIKEQTK